MEPGSRLKEPMAMLTVQVALRKGWYRVQPMVMLSVQGSHRKGWKQEQPMAVVSVQVSLRKGWRSQEQRLQKDSVRLVVLRKDLVKPRQLLGPIQ